MRKVIFFSSKIGKIMLLALTISALIGVFILAPAATNKVAAASTIVPVNMIYYGWHTAAVDNNIISAHPEFLVDNSPAGPWKGNASISKFTSAGIKYFEYIDGGYEDTAERTIPNDLESNLNYIAAAAAAGAYGIFLDEVSANPSAASLIYLSQIADKAHSLGLKIVFNTGVSSWSDSLMNYSDFISSSEVWNDTPLTVSQSKWASRTWLLTQNVTSATTAADLTNAAISNGIRAHYASTSYGSLPAWLDTYVAQINVTSPAIIPPVVATGTALNITISDAILNGTLSSMGSDSSVSVSFDWGLTASYGNTSAAGSMSNTGAFSAAITGLAPDTTYHFRAKAVGSSTVYGSDNVFQTATFTPSPTPAPTAGNTTGTVAGGYVATGAANEYSFNFKVTSTTVTGVKVGQQLWVAATTTDFPNLLTVESTLTGNLGKTPGWWILRSTVMDASAPSPYPAAGNTTGTIAGGYVATGAANEYSFNLEVTSSTVPGVTVGQQIWIAATTTDFPNLLTVGSTLTGNLDKTPGWWVLGE